jgi:hypothetical protein
MPQMNMKICKLNNPCNIWFRNIIKKCNRIKRRAGIAYSVSVGIATGYRLDDQGIRVRVPGGKNFHFSMSSRLALGPTQLPIQWVPRALSPGVKRPGREADLSPPTSTEVKKTWVCTSTAPYVFMAKCLIS